jgi:hypothetical protein
LRFRLLVNAARIELFVGVRHRQINSADLEAAVTAVTVRAFQKGGPQPPRRITLGHRPSPLVRLRRYARDLLLRLAACPKARSASVHDRCKAVYAQRLP